MFIHLKRIFMTAADNAGGSSPAPGQPAPAGGQPAPAPAPAQPPAQGAASQTPIDVNAIASAVHDKVFAALRQAGVLGAKAPRATTPAAPDPSNPAVTTEVPQIDLRSLDRVLGRTGHAARLSEQQYRRIETAYRQEAPDNTEQWVASYFEGWGQAPNPSAPASTTPAGTTASTQNRSAQPVSDGGSPPAPTAPLEERDIMSMSQEDRMHLQRTKGTAWYRAQLAKQTKGKTIRVV
jgi:hypothetical protein